MLSTFISRIPASSSFTVSHSARKGPAGPRPFLGILSDHLPLWAGWFRTGRAGWRSSGWWCRPVSSSPPPCSPTWWTTFRTLSVCLYCWMKLPRNVSPKGKKTPSQKTSGSSLLFYHQFFVWSLCSPNDLLPDLLLLRVPDAPLRTPEERNGCMHARNF